MVEPYFMVENELSADILCFAQNSIFAFDFKEEIYWVGNTIGSDATKVPLTLPNASFKRNKIALCERLPIFALITRDEYAVQIIDAQKNNSIKSIKLSDSKVECVSISDDGQSALVGGKNGALSHYDISTGKLLGIPARHKDFVLMARSSPDNRFIISVGYDKSVVFFDRNKDKDGVRLFNATSAIKCIKFSRDSSLAMLGDSEGFAYIIDTHTQVLLQKFQVALGGIANICHFKDSYIFVLSQNGSICLCDFVAKAKIMDSISQYRYKDFVIESDNIILSRDSVIVGYRFSDFVAYFKKTIDENNIAEAYKFANIHRFLQNDGAYLELEAKFEADMLEAESLACGGNATLAMRILERYMGIPSKSEAITRLVAQFKEIEKFNDLMANNLEIRALPLAQNNPLIKELRAYKDFEERFLKVMLLVKELAKKGRKDDANTLAMPFKKITSKVAIIQEILLYPHKVDEALNAIERGDIRAYFQLKKSYRFASILDGAKALEESAENLYFDALKAFYTMDVKECKNLIAILKNFREYREFALDLEVRIDECAGIIEKMKK